MATITDFGIPGVSNGILQPKLKDAFRVTFANLGAGSDSQPVSAQIKSVDRPNLDFDEIQLDRYNSRAWVASKHTWQPINMVIEDDITGSATQVLQNQLQSQKFIIGAEGPYLARSPEGSQYKFVCYIDMLDGNDTILERWTLEGCWIKSCNWGNMAYADSDSMNIELTLRFDHARQDVVGFEDGQGVALGGPGQN